MSSKEITTILLRQTLGQIQLQQGLWKGSHWLSGSCIWSSCRCTCTGHSRFSARLVLFSESASSASEAKRFAISIKQVFSPLLFQVLKTYMERKKKKTTNKIPTTTLTKKYTIKPSYIKAEKIMEYNGLIQLSFIWMIIIHSICLCFPCWLSI